MRRRRTIGPVPIGALLGALVAVALVPSLLFTAVLLERNSRAQQESLTTLAEAIAGSIMETVDRQLSGMVTTLRILSSAPSFEEENFAEFYVRTRNALDDTASHFLLLDEDLNQIFNTRVPFGTPLGRTSDPASAGRALETGEVVISDAFFSETAQKWVFHVHLPRMENGKRYVLSMTHNAEDLGEVLASQNLRGGWNASIVDRNGIVVASSFLSSDVGKPFFLAPGATDAAETSRRAYLVEGEEYETITTRSDLSGWRGVLWAPAETVEGPLVRSLRTFALGGFLLAGLSALAAWLLARQVSDPVRELSEDARRLGAGEDVTEKHYPIAEIATVSTALAEASRDRIETENEIRFLMREVAHRSKNQLTVVSSIAKQTARNAPDIAGFQDAFQKRVQGLARSTDLLIQGGVAGVELRTLLEAQMEPFRPGDGARLTMEGPRFRLSNQAAQTIGLAVHELATNASKYGAFSSNSGRLAIEWGVEGSDLVVTWRETVARLAEAPERRGFGTEVIERMLGGTLDAAIERELRPDGLFCRFTMPLEKIRPDPAAARSEKRFG